MRGVCALIAVLAFGCSRDAYRCASSDQCVQGGKPGVCEPTGFCSFEDPSCPGGRKYEDNAGGGLAGDCIVVDAGVDATMIDQCVKQVTHGRHFGCVLRDDGTVWCVGANQRGQIGFGLAGAMNQPNWMQVHDTTTGTPITDATDVFAAWEHACAIRAGGAAWCWGRGDTGQLGNNAAGDRPAAVQVLKELDNMPLTGVVEIGGGYRQTCARDNAGAVWCWGGNINNELGDNTTTQRNRAVQIASGALSLRIGRDQGCISKANNEVWCWGRNQDGQLGTGDRVNKPVPTMVGTAKDFDIAVFTMCRINMDDTVSCNGSTWRGRLGNGLTNDVDDVLLPSQGQIKASPDGPPLENAAKIVMGGSPCVVLADGVAKCWGDNAHGQSGVGATARYPVTPRRSNGKLLDNVERIVAGTSHFCAFLKTGEIECWGRGSNGEYGDGKLEDRGAPAPLVFPCP